METKKISAWTDLNNYNSLNMCKIFFKDLTRDRIFIFKAYFKSKKTYKDAL